jgi:hypothetical protein
MATQRSAVRSRAGHGHYYLYKVLIFFVLTASSFMFINSVMVTDSAAACGSSFLFRERLASCDQVGAAESTTEQEEGVGKTIWNPVAKSWLTAEQVALLKLAYDVGLQDGGLTHAQLLQSTMLQETIAGQLGRVGHHSAPVGKRSYGVMQVKVTAALDVLNAEPALGGFRTDEELIVRLMMDDEFNIRVASKFLLRMREKTSSDSEALVAYNIGLRAARRSVDHDEFRYVKNVTRYYVDVVRPFNRKYLRLELEEPATAASSV